MRISLWLPAVLLLCACPPEDEGLTRGDQGKLEFSLPDGSRLAAGGATAHIKVGLSGSAKWRFSSSDPSLLEVTSDGIITTHNPGQARVVASDGGGEVDGFTFTVAAVTTIQVRAHDAQSLVTPTKLMPGFSQVLDVLRSDAGGGLGGSGGMIVESEGQVAADSSDGTGSDLWGNSLGDGFVVHAIDVGDGLVRVRIGGALLEHHISVIGADAIDDMQISAPSPEGWGAGKSCVRVSVRALSVDQPVSGALCNWTTPDATLGLNSVEPDGSESSDFCSASSTIHVTCQLGKISRTVELAVPKQG